MFSPFATLVFALPARHSFVASPFILEGRSEDEQARIFAFPAPGVACMADLWVRISMISSTAFKSAAMTVIPFAAKSDRWRILVVGLIGDSMYRRIWILI